MAKLKKILKRLLYPHGLLVFVLTVVSAAGLCYVFLNGLDTHPIAYVMYVLSAYALCTLVAAIIPLIFKGRNLLYRNSHTARYLTQSELRMRTSLYVGTAVNLAYGIFKLFTGVYFRSFWFGAVAVYYMVLCWIRFLLIKNDRYIQHLDGEEARHLRQWNSYRTCGWLLLALNATMTGMVFQVIWQNKNYAYPGFVIYASAAYTFYRLTMAIVRNIKLRKAKNPVFSAAKAIDLSVALMAIFALQSAMFATFGGDTSADFRIFMNAMTGGTVCFMVVCIAAFMLIRSGKTLKTLQINKTET